MRRNDAGLRAVYAAFGPDAAADLTRRILPGMADRWDLIRVSLARKFFLLTVLQAAAVIGIALLFGAALGRQTSSSRLQVPGVFVVSTVLLAAGSAFLEYARRLVRLEQQARFRRSLLIALVCAMLFVAIQGYGLWAFDKGLRSAEAAQMGIHSFVIMAIGIHAMHFIVAQSVLLWVTLSAFADRYDHEYFWGVTFAGWCWHALGIVWLAILFLMAMAMAS